MGQRSEVRMWSWVRICLINTEVRYVTQLEIFCIGFLTYILKCFFQTQVKLFTNIMYIQTLQQISVCTRYIYIYHYTLYKYGLSFVSAQLTNEN